MRCVYDRIYMMECLKWKKCRWMLFCEGRSFNLMQNNFLIKDGKSEYKILFSNVRDPETMLNKATGVNLELVNDCGMNIVTGDYIDGVDEEGVLFNEDSKYISIGENLLLKRAGLFEDVEGLKPNDYKIKTVKNCIFIYGATSVSAAYGVYGFLKELLNFDFFFKDCLHIDKVSELAFKELEITKIADLERVPLSYGFSEHDRVAVRRYGFSYNNETTIPVDGQLGHNFIWGIFPPVKHAKTHPKWYYTADNPRQPCFTAHGDENELAQMIDECVNVAKTEIIRNPKRTMMLLAIEDHFRACQCESCADAKKKYGSHAGAMINFSNRVARKVNDWFETDEGKIHKRKILFNIYAYLEYEDAPVVYDEERKEYVPTIRCDENVVPQIAPVHADYQFSFYHKENEQYYKNIQNWKKVASDIGFFLYDTNYHNLLIPYNTFDSLQDNYRLGKECNSSYFYNLGQSVQRNYSTGWSALKVYWQSKLTWDVNADLEYYTDKFFTYYFKESAPIMRKWFNECLIHLRYLRDELSVKGYRSLFVSYAQKEYWPKDLLLRWLEYAETSLATVAQVEGDYYEQLCIKKHILCERVSPLYLLTVLYKDELPKEEFERFKELLINDIETLGFSNYREHVGIKALYDEICQ